MVSPIGLELAALSAITLTAIQLPLRTRHSQRRIISIFRYTLRHLCLQPKSVGQVELGNLHAVAGRDTQGNGE